MATHGEVRNTYEREYIVLNKEPEKKGKVVELYRLETYLVKEVYCAQCESWQEADDRYFITDIFCPTCCTDWK